MPRIKICCIASISEAELAIQCGADALGLVSAMPSGPGVITERTIAEIARAVGRRVPAFLLTSLTDPRAVAEQWRRCGTSVIQLTDGLAGGVESLRQLRALAPGAALVQVVHVRDESSLAEAAEYAPHADGLLLDSGNPSGKVKTLGGTGLVHDWLLSRRIVAANPQTPVWLAGGLNPENVARAVARVGSHGLDICSGVRTDGRLDAGKLRAFLAWAKGWAAKV